MLDEDRSIRAVAWSEVFPWLKIVRAFRLAIGARVLLLAAAAILLTYTGWWVVGAVCHGQHFPESSLENCPWTALTGMVGDEPALIGILHDRPSAWPKPRLEPMSRTWRLLSAPLLHAFDFQATWGRLGALVLSGLWSLAVWAWFGAAITRVVAVQVAAEETVSWSAMVGHATSKWLSYVGAPLCPLLGIALAGLPVLVAGLLLRTDVGIFLMGLVWPLFLLCGAIIVLLLVGLLFGWPLMWSTISSEGTDSFDALSRSYAYMFQRPLHYLFYVAVAAVVGTLGWLLVSEVAAGIVGLTYWAATWGSTVPRALDIVNVDPGLGFVGRAGAWLIHFWTGCVKLLAVGFLFSYFWSATTIIYFLLRRDVDATEMDEVYLEDEPQSYALPPLKTDEAGAPVVADAPAAEPPAEPPAAGSP